MNKRGHTDFSAERRDVAGKTGKPYLNWSSKTFELCRGKFLNLRDFIADRGDNRPNEQSLANRRPIWNPASHSGLTGVSSGLGKAELADLVNR